MFVHLTPDFRTALTSVRASLLLHQGHAGSTSAATGREESPVRLSMSVGPRAREVVLKWDHRPASLAAPSATLADGVPHRSRRVGGTTRLCGWPSAPYDRVVGVCLSRGWRTTCCRRTRGGASHLCVARGRCISPAPRRPRSPQGSDGTDEPSTGQDEPGRLPGREECAGIWSIGGPRLTAPVEPGCRR